MSYNQIDPVFKAQWLDALRSGEYEQGSGALRINYSIENDGFTDSQFCCLGVACDILNPYGWNEATQSAWDDLDGNRHDESDTDGLPFLAEAEVGWPDTDDQSPGGALAQLNDSGKSFLEIADWIEENL